MSQPTRRNLFQILSAVPAAAALAAPAEAADKKSHAPATYQAKVVTDPAQWRTLRVVCDLIIPADEHSGSATQAGVPEFIDDWLDFRAQEDGNDNLTAEILGGLTWLELEATRLFQKSFADAAPTQQTQILDRIAWPLRAKREDMRWASFFTALRDLTANGFYSSKMGIADLPYQGNTAVEQWTGCDPVVWAEIERRMRHGYKASAGTVAPVQDVTGR